MKTEKTNEDSISLDEKIALMLSHLDKIMRHFKIDRRSKNNPDEPAGDADTDEEGERLLRELSHKVGEIADRKEFTTEQIAELKKIFTGIANFFLKEQDGRHGEIKSSLDAVTELLGALKAEKQDSVVEHHHRHAIEVASSKVFISMVAMGLMIFLSFVFHIYQLDQLRAFRDNDLKYRYVKMRDGATPGEIKALETNFTYDRNADSVQLIRRQVIQYERLVKEQAEKIEQARLNASEAERLRHEVETVKGGK
jgi:hypothetical protein